jgi:hypothetical protein
MEKELGSCGATWAYGGGAGLQGVGKGVGRLAGWATKQKERGGGREERFFFLFLFQISKYILK